MKNYSGKNCLVMGLGISGRSAAELLLQEHATVIGVDEGLSKIDPSKINPLITKGLKVKDTADINLNEIDLVVVSPGIPRTHPLYLLANTVGKEIIGEIELACQFIKDQNKPVIGITGTNGKTTVTLLVEHILNEAGIKAKALGNMGIPLTSEFLDSSVKSDLYVIELSSYQLETFQTTVIDFGVILNITPDHLDRYGNMQEYAKAKYALAKCIKANGSLWVEKGCHEMYGHLFGEECALKTYGFSTSCDLYCDLQSLKFEDIKEQPLPISMNGKKNHDVENIMAAYALCCELDIDQNKIISAIKNFKKPAHRIEFVKKINEVSYYDDSKGTNIDAVIRAVESLSGSIVLIAGGVDKGFPYTSWIKNFGNKVKYICAIGASAIKIKEELSAQIPVRLFETLDDAVKYASTIANEGENVLLSPGCASFDMFRDYAHRGEEFKRIVNEI